LFVVFGNNNEPVFKKIPELLDAIVLSEPDIYPCRSVPPPTPVALICGIDTVLLLPVILNEPV
jgi:hypothetical protein